MSIPAAVSIVAAVVGLGVAALALGVGSSPRWSRYRILSAIAVTASAYCAAEVGTVVPLEPAVLLAILRVQATAGIANVLLWQLYGDRHLARVPRRWEKAARLMMLVLAALCLVPGLMVGPAPSTFAVPPLDVVYRFQTPTTLGSLTFALEIGFLVLTMARYVSALRRGVEGSAGHLAALAAIWVAGVHDALVGSGLYRAPFLLSAGFIVSVGAMGVLLTRSFVADASKLDQLTQSLEQLVQERTSELVNAEAALMRSEKLCALGQLSAGVAHEINNPCAAVAGNLAYLRDGLRTGSIPADAIECIDDSLDAVDRIAEIVRQLLDLGREAASETKSHSTNVRGAVQQALEASRGSFAANVHVSVDVSPALFVRAEEGPLEQVLVSLLVNAAQAIPGSREGHVVVRAVQVQARVVITIADDGTGISDEAKRRIFEPFFTTRPFGQGTGLGLPRSLGIVRSLSGALRVESRPGATVITVELPAGEVPADASTNAPPAEPAASGEAPDDLDPEPTAPPQNSLVVEKLPKGGERGGVG